MKLSFTPPLAPNAGQASGMKSGTIGQNAKDAKKPGGGAFAHFENLVSEKSVNPKFAINRSETSRSKTMQINDHRQATAPLRDEKISAKPSFVKTAQSANLIVKAQDDRDMADPSDKERVEPAPSYKPSKANLQKAVSDHAERIESDNDNPLDEEAVIAILQMMTLAQDKRFTPASADLTSKTEAAKPTLDDLMQSLSGDAPEPAPSRPMADMRLQGSFPTSAPRPEATAQPNASQIAAPAANLNSDAAQIIASNAEDATSRPHVTPNSVAEWGASRQSAATAQAGTGDIMQPVNSTVALTSPQMPSLALDPSSSTDFVQAARRLSEADLAQMNQIKPTETLQLQLKPLHLGLVTATLTLSQGQLSVDLGVETMEAHQRLLVEKEAISKVIRDLGFEVDRVSIHAPTGTSTADRAPSINDAGASMSNRRDSETLAGNEQNNQSRPDQDTRHAQRQIIETDQRTRLGDGDVSGSGHYI